MAARRVGQRAIDWVAFAERVPPNQKSQFNALKSKADGLSSRLASMPEQPKAIDWAYYKKVVPAAGLVDKFQKQFDELKVPFPMDTASAKIEQQSKEMDTMTAEFKKGSDQRIAQYDKEITKLKNMTPFEEMTVEEMEEAFPHMEEQKKKYPWWPHYPVWEG
ncbi:ATP synthase subunit d, mitochondrial-like [Acanthaster planci]|uniref:ATP synthase subunit d, mitochondrial n=1 Tax=Acanthaster planci TaxID=133434 RepID=A0A8B7YLP6_ACAPL|nr:ATP synthase subunit d, mitochondrial-like [Acanthaster planci]